MAGWLWNDLLASETACQRGDPLASSVLLGWVALLVIAAGVEIALIWRARFSLSQTATAVMTVAGLGVCAIFVARAVWFIGHGCAS